VKIRKKYHTGKTKSQGVGALMGDINTGWAQETNQGGKKKKKKHIGGGGVLEEVDFGWDGCGESNPEIGLGVGVANHCTFGRLNGKRPQPGGKEHYKQGGLKKNRANPTNDQPTFILRHKRKNIGKIYRKTFQPN